LAIKLKSQREIELMRNAGRVVAAVLKRLGEMIAPGVTTAELDAEAVRLTQAMGATCLFKGVPGRGGPFPGNICASINEQVVHGIPSSRAIRVGDVVSIDFGARLDGYCGDAAGTWLVGQGTGRAAQLVAVTRQALDIAVKLCRPGIKWSAVARAMQQHVESNGFSVVREFVGHGIGQDMHEDPKVPNFVSRDLLARDIDLREGLVLAVEPMVNMGSPAVEHAADGWTVLTKDRLPAAHFEQTLVVRGGGCEILTDGK
jgi:methionyl aminopeptidase